MTDLLSERDFQRLAEVIEAYCGIRMPEAKHTMAEGRLRRRVRALGLGTLTEYCRFLFDQGGLEQELGPLIDSITTNKTDFFREPDHFDFLVHQVLPALLAGRHTASGTLVKVWSAACSNGAEPYTLAMVLADAAARMNNFRFAILGTDICTDVLAQAVRAIYPEDMAAPVPAPLRARYLMRARDAHRHEVRVVPELRRLVHFGQLNLVEDSYPVDHDVDVIFIRNVLIYFDKALQKAVLERLCGHLRPGGYLFLGHSESMAGAALPLRQVASTVFRRV